MSGRATVDIGRESVVGFLAQLVDKGVGLVVFVYFANFFPPDQFGGAYVVIGAATVLKTVPDGLNLAVRKRVSEQTDAYPEYATIGGGWLLAYTVALGLVVAAVTRFVSVPYESLAFAGVAFVGGRSANALIKRLYAGIGSPGFENVVDVIDGVLTAALRFGLILGLDVGAAGLLYGPALSGGVVCVGLYAARFDRGLAVPSLGHVRSLVSFARYSVRNVGYNTLYHNAGVLLIGGFVGGAAASTYKTAERLTVSITTPAQVVSTALVVHLSGRREAGEPVAVAGWVSAAAVLAPPIIAGCVALGDEIMLTTYGPAYAGTGAILAGVALYVGFEAIERALVGVLNGLDSPEEETRFQRFRVFALLPAVVFGTWVGGLSGLVVAFAVIKPVETVFVLRATQAELDGPGVDHRLLARQAVAGGAVAVTTEAASAALPVRSFVDLALLVGLGGAVYVVALGSISGQYRSEFRRLLTLAAGAAGRVRP